MTRQRGIGVGIIGAGNVLPAYLKVLDRLVPRGLAWEGPICARRRSTWPALSARRPSARLVESPDEVLGSDVDVVVIITSPGTHAELSIAALRAGKHVVCEKPLGRTLDEATTVFDEASSRGLHVLAAPFVHLSPTLRELWTRVADGEIGHVHTARASYGNIGATWAGWYRRREIGPLAEAGIYNLKSLTAILGPATEVFAAEAATVPSVGADERSTQGDAVQVVLRHASGALSSVTTGFSMRRYRRPALELYGTEGTINLLGDDWDPLGIEIWRDDRGAWTSIDPRDPTWSWADGLRELVTALHEDRPPLAHPDHDLHIIEIVDLAAVSAREGRMLPVASAPAPPDLRLEIGHGAARIHDHTRAPDDQ